jgi:hypothetical protein
MVDKNDPLLREVQEELRREQWTKLWNKYGNYAIAAAGLIVVLVGGYKFWEARALARAEAAGAQYEAALTLLQNGKTEEAKTSLSALAADGPRGYATLSELLLAGANLKAGKSEDALAIFEKVGRDGGADDLLASFAQLQAAAIRLGSADFTEMQNRLTPLTADTSPWRNSARELLGMAALKAGKVGEARAALSPLLTDPSVPEEAVERIRRMMGTIASAEVAKTAPPAAATEGAPPTNADASDGSGKTEPAPK